MIMPSDGLVSDELTDVLRRLERLQSTVYAVESERDKLNARLETIQASASDLAKDLHRARTELSKALADRAKLSQQLDSERAGHRQTMRQRDAYRADSSNYAATFLTLADLAGRWDGLSFTMSGEQAAKALREALAGAGALAATEAPAEAPAEAAPARPDVATLRAVRQVALDVGNSIMDHTDRPWYRFVDLLDRAITKTSAAEQA
jgi:septal ring factor EnvC (AmiA/AmiB activator)